MPESNHVLHTELSVDRARDVNGQLPPQLSASAHPTTATSTSALPVAPRVKEWNANSGNSNKKLEDTAAYHAFFDNLPGMACQIQLDAHSTLHFNYVSQGSSALLGITPLELEKHPNLLLDSIHPEDQAAFFNSIRQSAIDASPWNWEGRIVLLPASEIKWVNLRATHRETSSHGTVWEGFMVNITQNKLSEQEIIKSRQQLRELSSHVDSIKEEERMRIAREVHDEIGVLLTALKMDLAWLTQRLPQDNSALHEKARSMANLLDTAGSAANNLVHSLRPGFLDCFGIVAAIEIEANEFSKRTSIPCRIIKSDDSIELPSEQSITLFRVFQETLNNIMKHAMAKQVQVKICKTEKYVELVVSDNGKGFDESSRNKPRSFGLRGIQERIKYLGGNVRITSEPGKGAQIAVSVPLGKM